MSQIRYQTLCTIGTGASSRVDKAHDTLIDRTVVLKTFATGFGSPELQREFLREAQILGRLSHPNIISIYDLGTNEDGSAYLVTEYVPGKTLDAVMTERGPIPLARAGVWAGDLASALSRAHKAGIIHGDVKPANIFVTDDGQIKLGDFGIARFATQVSGAASLVGTPAYLSPEQIKGESQDHRSDIFSVGIVLYQLTTGVRPFDGTSVAAVCAQIVARQPPPPSHYNRALPAEFDRIVMRCLAKNPGDRYASGESLAASLYPFGRNQPHRPLHRFNFAWLKGPLRPAEAWIFGATVVATLAAIPVAHGLYNAHRRPAVLKSKAETSAVDFAVAAPPQPTVDFAPQTSKASESRSVFGQTRPVVTRVSEPKAALSDAPAVPSTSLKHNSSGSLADSSTNASPATINKAALPAPRTAIASPPHNLAFTSLAIEISSAIDGGMLAIFVDRQLVATSPLSATHPGESLHLDRPLPVGPHEFRVALYRQDKTLQTEKQGLAELQRDVSNLLKVHVVRRSKMLVKRNADLDILWPSTPAAKPAPERSGGKTASPLVATSVAASQ